MLRRIFRRRERAAALATTDPMLLAMVQAANPKYQRGTKQVIGMGAFARLPAQVQGLVEYALKDAARKKNCRVSDLVWTLVRHPGAKVPVVHVKKRERIEL